MVRKKLSERSNPETTWEGPYEGVPVWMGQALADWVTTILTEQTICGNNIGRQRLQRIQAGLRVQLNWGNETEGGRSSAEWCSSASP